MQDAVDDALGLLGDRRGDAHAPEGKPRAAAREPALVLPLDPVGVDARLLSELGEKRVDRVVRADALERHHGRPHGLLVDAPAVAGLGDVASCPAERLEERRLEVRAREEVLRELEGASGVLDDLARLDPRNVVEEPAAARVHELRVPLHLEQLQDAHPLFRRQRPGSVPCEESVHALGRAVEDHVDVVVARRPRIGEQARRAVARTAAPERRAGGRAPPAAAPARPGSSPGGRPCCSRSRFASARRRGRSSRRCSRRSALRAPADASPGTRRSSSGARSRRSRWCASA